MPNQELLLAIKDLVESEQFDVAMPLIYGILEDDPNDVMALNFLGYIYLVSGKDALAYYTFKHASNIAPTNKAIVANLGKAAHELGRFEEAIQQFLEAAKLDPDYAMAYANASASLVQMSQWDDAEKAALLALECDPKELNATMNLAHVYFAKGDWQKAWKHFGLSLGSKFRKEYGYADETRWNGEKNKSLVIYGEQGLGDEVMYASILPEVIEDSKHVIVDCDAKLEGLFKRSFPKATVYGTRRDDHPEWLKGAKIDHRCALGGLGEFYRTTDESFSGKPYLVADPERRIMWRALFDGYKKPVIGITSHGGVKKNNEAGRTLSYEDLRELLNDTRYEFVSLDYKDGVTHKRLRQFPFATKSDDMDDTAALISELDLVVGVNTTAHHLAGALGVKTVTLVPKYHWARYARDHVWYKSQTLVKQGLKTWKEVVKGLKIADYL